MSRRRPEVAPDTPMDVQFWTLEQTNAAPMLTGDVLNVLDVRGRLPRAGLAVRRAGLLLVGSAAEFGAWAALAGSTAIAVVPPVIEAHGEVADAFRALHILVGPAPSPEAKRMAERAAAWAGRRGIAYGIAGASDPSGLGLVARLGAAPAWATGAIVLDTRVAGDTPEPLLAALASGAPVLFRDETPLRRALEAEQAAWRLDDLEAGLDAVAALPAARLREMSAAALAFVRQHFSADPAPLQRALRAAGARLREAEAHWAQRGPGSHILVISDEAFNLLDIRVHLPFAALLRRGAISGYSVLRHGEFVFSSAPVTPDLRFGAIWVQRSVDPLVQLLLQLLDRPFIYDLDDNLLVSPSYRRPFTASSVETARGLIRTSTVLSCATPRLARLLQEHGAEGAVAKTIVTPNLAEGDPQTAAGTPRVVVWASSDRPALAGSRREVERAVRDFCRAHSLRLLCLGCEPPALFRESGLDIEHVGLLSYAAYRARLREAAPGILVGPLETEGDAETQAFVDAKSDIKVIEARLAGLVGVFSRAAPYVESDLAPPILCDNTYASWLDGLERARNSTRPPAPWPRRRDADALGPMPWAEALCHATTDLSAAEVLDAVRFMRAQGETLLEAPDLFDEGDYLERHEDVRQAVADGVVVSGYRHYVQSGFREGRPAKRRAVPEADASFWWSLLLHRVGRLETDVAARGRDIDALRDRVALRRVLPDRPAPPPPVAIEAPASAVQWYPGGDVALPCPVCDAAGPHPTLLQTEGLQTEGATLARCGQCRSCFYADRTPHRYETDGSADVLLQLYLEQNAGIYHQTRPLFAVDGADSLLDIGCGFGFAVDLASGVLGWRAVGVDPSFYAAAGAAQLGADIRTEYLSDATELGPPFALVSASEVIEHLPDPYAFLALLRARLAPSGTLVLTTPNALALEPGLDSARLTGILALRVHLTLFTPESLALALRRAGFKHVTVESTVDTLVAYAADRPLRWREDADERHRNGYRHYLAGLLDRAAPGTALWNGAAGRLFALLAPTAELATLHALFARIVEAWRARFGLDLARLRLPEQLSEAALHSATAASLGARQPLNLAGVLFNRALAEQRTPGRTPEAVLAYARPAYLHAVQTRRILQAENMIDLDLQQTAWRARLLIVDCLAELAPELEGELLAALAEPSPGALAEWIDPPPDAVAARVAPYFTATVASDRFDAARRLAPEMRDLDRLARALADQPDVLLRALFTLGVQHLVADRDPAAALEAFTRMADEARRRLDQPGRQMMARDFLRIAQEHMQLATTRLAGDSTSQ